MNSDPSNTERDNAGSRPSAPRALRRVAWEQKGGVDTDSEQPPTPLASAWSGILLAAACYPIVVVGIVMTYQAFVFGGVAMPENSIGMLLSYLLFSFMIGFIYGAVMAVPAFLLVRMLKWSLEGVISSRAASGIFGGLTGFLCVSGGGLIYINGIPPAPDREVRFFFILMPLLAIAMGYVGAIWSGYLSRFDGFPFYEPLFTFKKQITISYLMKLTLIVAVLAAIFKAAGTSAINIGFAWLAYLLVQTLLLIGDHWLTSCLSRR